MTRDEAISALEYCCDGDPEGDHSAADAVLLKFLAANGFEDIVAAYEKVRSNCGGFWYA